MSRSYPMMPAILAAAILGIGFRRRVDVLDDYLDDRLDTLGLILGSSASAPRPPHRPSNPVVHIDTPKPISKRKARRLRGKGTA